MSVGDPCSWVVVGQACHVAGGLAGHAAGYAVRPAEDGLAAWTASGAAWLLGAVGSAMQTSTQVHLGAPWFATHERLMATIAAATAAPLLMAAVLQALVRQDAGLLARAALVQLPLALLLSGLAVQLVALGLQITDQLCGSLARASGGSLHRSFQHLETVARAMGSAPGLGGASTLIVLLVALFVVVGGLVLWLELLIRAAAVYVAVLFVPLAMVSLVWPPVAQFGRRLWHLLAGLVLSKFVIVAVLVLGIGAVGSQGRSSGGVATLLSGAAMLFLAAVMPFVVLRLVPMAEGALNMEGVRTRGLHTAIGVPMSAARLALGASGALPMAGAEAGTGMAGVGGEVAGADAVGAGPGAVGAGPGAVGVGADAEGAVAGHGGAIGAAREGGDSHGVSDPDSAVPPWQGNPASDRAFEETLGGRGALPHEVDGTQNRGPTAASTVLRVGAPPVWGVPFESAADGRDDAGAVTEAPVTGSGAVTESEAVTGSDVADRSAAVGTHVIDHDRLGPVIRWVPPSGAADEPDDENDA